MVWWLCSLALGEPLQVSHDAAIVDPNAVRGGVSIRLGAAAEDWRIEVLGSDSRRVDLKLRSPDRQMIQRDVTLEGDSVEERSRELTAALVIIIEGYEGPEGPASSQGQDPPPPDPPTPSEPIHGWIGVAGRLALSGSQDLEGGAEVLGGVWVLQEILQPWVEAGWGRSTAGSLTIDGLRVGAGLAAGHPLWRRRLWLGGGIMVRALWANARAQQRVSAWSSSTFVGALAQGRFERVPIVLVGRMGADLGAPVLVFSSDDDEVRWGNARFSASLGIAFALGAR